MEDFDSHVLTILRGLNLYHQILPRRADRIASPIFQGSPDMAKSMTALEMKQLSTDVGIAPVCEVEEWP